MGIKYVKPEHTRVECKWSRLNSDSNILPNVNLVLRWSDTRGETVETTRAMVDMICDGVAAFFGPEGSCYVEAIVAQSRNIPMISYMSTMSHKFFPHGD
ncbi:hypothetical protein PV327_010420 [Microctonus hyperodae]|uniref:Receptor ligand binding region domain-containing protein n=1 Tax=Microctonus hyperodae TaxID=165561 RepID=A0AA39FS45_MICHY|nr:hypothetical protein PV327_010420 [Microctonus hyperodae]